MTMSMAMEQEAKLQNWEYVETRTAKIRATPQIELVPHWYGAHDAEEVRAVVRRGVNAVNNHDALVEAVKHALAIEESTTLKQERELRSRARAIYQAALSAAQE